MSAVAEYFTDEEADACSVSTPCRASSVKKSAQETWSLHLVLENLALRQQLAVLRRRAPRELLGNVIVLGERHAARATSTTIQAHAPTVQGRITGLASLPQAVTRSETRPYRSTAGHDRSGCTGRTAAGTQARRMSRSEVSRPPHTGHVRLLEARRWPRFEPLITSEFAHGCARVREVAQGLAGRPFVFPGRAERLVIAITDGRRSALTRIWVIDHTSHGLKRASRKPCTFACTAVL